MQKVFKVGLIGCGHIAETYFKGHKYFNNFRIIKCADIKHSAAINIPKGNPPQTTQNNAHKLMR